MNAYTSSHKWHLIFSDEETKAVNSLIAQALRCSGSNTILMDILSPTGLRAGTVFRVS